MTTSLSQQQTTNFVQHHIHTAKKLYTKKGLISIMLELAGTFTEMRSESSTETTSKYRFQKRDLKSSIEDPIDQYDETETSQSKLIQTTEEDCNFAHLILTLLDTEQLLTQYYTICTGTETNTRTTYFSLYRHYGVILRYATGTQRRASPKTKIADKEIIS